MRTEIERIIALSNAFGPSGFEDEVCQIVKEELSEFDLVEDHLRNVRTNKKIDSSKPKVMLDAHLDEVGAIVQAIAPNGTMHFLTLGNMLPENLTSTSFLIQNQRNEKIPAIVASRPPHFSHGETKHVATLQDLVLDCGSCSDIETRNDFHIEIGNFAVPNVTCSFQEDKNLFFGKAFDCRIGVAAEIEVLKRLNNQSLPCNVQGAFSSQEEVGERGVYANYKALQPDLMICFEGCPADDTFQPAYFQQTKLGYGPMLRRFDRSMITNPRFQDFAVEIAKKYEIPMQQSVRSGGGTDAGRIHQEDVPSIVIGIPVRYIHSHYCYMNFQDYQNAVKLAVALCQNLTKEVIQSF